MTKKTYEELGQRVGALVDVKNAAYGSSFDDAGSFLRILYPNGIQPEQYGDALALVRIFDKMKRIATDRDALGESPYQDIAGYGLLGLHRVETSREAAKVEAETGIDRVSTLPPPPKMPEVPESTEKQITTTSNSWSRFFPNVDKPPTGGITFTGKKTNSGKKIKRQ